MKNVSKAILITLAMVLPASVMASPDDDVTIRMMDANENTTQAVTRHIELPEAADDRAKEHADEGLAAQNRNRNRNGESADHEMEREMEMEREGYNEREMNRDDRKDVEHDGIDRGETEHEGFGHGGDLSQPKH